MINVTSAGEMPQLEQPNNFRSRLQLELVIFIPFEFEQMSPTGDF
jgi:hypothetical protein